MKDLKKIGLALKFRRLELELSQEQLAAKSRVERTYISGIENGRKNVSLAVFLQLVKALDIEPWDILKTAFKK